MTFTFPPIISPHCNNTSLGQGPATSHIIVEFALIWRTNLNPGLGGFIYCFIQRHKWFRFTLVKVKGSMVLLISIVLTSMKCLRKVMRWARVQQLGATQLEDALTEHSLAIRDRDPIWGWCISAKIRGKHICSTFILMLEAVGCCLVKLNSRDFLVNSIQMKVETDNFISMSILGFKQKQ